MNASGRRTTRSFMAAARVHGAMKRWAAIAVGSLAIALAIWALFFRGGSEEDAIRGVVKKTAEAVKVIEGENPVMRATRVRSELLETLAKDVSVSIPELTD